jgi:hypothetical protein
MYARQAGVLSGDMLGEAWHQRFRTHVLQGENASNLRIDRLTACLAAEATYSLRLRADPALWEARIREHTASMSAQPRLALRPAAIGGSPLQVAAAAAAAAAVAAPAAILAPPQAALAVDAPPVARAAPATLPPARSAALDVLAAAASANDEQDDPQTNMCSDCGIERRNAACTKSLCASCCGDSLGRCSVTSHNQRKMQKQYVC